MSKVNIPRNQEDPFYRYTRPVIKISYTKKNIIIENMYAAVKAINRDIVEVSTYMRPFVGRQVIIEDNIATIPNFDGKPLEIKDIDDILEKFISEFVICKKCGNPETIYVHEKKSVSISCSACGYLSLAPESRYLKKQIHINKSSKKTDKKDKR